MQGHTIPARASSTAANQRLLSAAWWLPTPPEGGPVSVAAPVLSRMPCILVPDDLRRVSVVGPVPVTRTAPW